jgi:adenosylcobinamide-GDP ribazoletransferase
MKRALSFLTPIGKSSTPNAMTLSWFPVVGALLGLLIGTIWWLASKSFAPLVAAGVVVVADLILTGFLHFDGLADAGDGLLPPLTKERRLEVMADPAIGAFGAICIVAALILRFSALASVRPSILVLGGLWCASRTSMAAIAVTMPYARPDGLANNFVARESRSAFQRNVLFTSLVSGYLLAAILVLLGRGLRGFGALGAELVAAGAVAWLSKRRIGGFTGDVLGAAGVVGETIGLLVLATR